MELVQENCVGKGALILKIQPNDESRQGGFSCHWEKNIQLCFWSIVRCVLKCLAKQTREGQKEGKRDINTFNCT